MTKQFRDFEFAREFAQKLEFTSISKWREYCKSGNKPDDVPSSPEKVYKKEWISWPEFLGNGNIASQKREFSSFKEARKYVHNLKLKDVNEWKQYSKSGKRPSTIPGAPNEVYKNQGWVGISDWLGNGNLSNKNRNYFSYEECSKIIQKNNISTRKQFADFRKKFENSEKIPGHPWDVYKKQGKKFDWGDFTGTGKVANQNKQYRPFNQAREFVRKLGLKNQKEWQEYSKSRNKPAEIPAAPWSTYKKEWKGYGDWLSTGRIANQNKQYRPFNQAREFVRSLGLKSTIEWSEYCKSGNKPDDIPSTPWKIYKEWK